MMQEQSVGNCLPYMCVLHVGPSYFTYVQNSMAECNGDRFGPLLRTLSCPEQSQEVAGLQRT
jgi:hypothetical protein